jgi:hypothetical protein
MGFSNSDTDYILQKFKQFSFNNVSKGEKLKIFISY